MLNRMCKSWNLPIFALVINSSIMAIKNFFTGKSGLKFWLNIFLMLLLLVAVPVVTFMLLDSFTHHGEKIEVPNVVGKSQSAAESMLKEHGLVAVVVDSTYDKSAMRGSVLEQSPTAGYEVKGGRVVYLTVNMNGEPIVELPDVVNYGSLREAESLLKSMGFKLTPHESLMGRPKDLVIAVKQGGREVYAGQRVSRERPLTIVIGGGEIDTTEVVMMYDSTEVDDVDFDIDL